MTNVRRDCYYDGYAVECSQGDAVLPQGFTRICTPCNSQRCNSSSNLEMNSTLVIIIFSVITLISW